jgi:hypothetical protein
MHAGVRMGTVPGVYASVILGILTVITVTQWEGD